MSENFRGGSLVDWRLALQREGHTLAAQLREEADPYAVVASLGLPTPLYIAFDSVTPFVHDPHTFLHDIISQGVEKFYVGLRPKEATLPKFREIDLGLEETVSYIQKYVAPANYEKYFLRIAEYAPAEYGATMIINPSGALYLEMVQGEMSNLATGARSPEFTAWADQFTSVMHYSFEDQLLRCKVWQSIQAIPTIDDGSGRPPRLPGYYEFSLIKRGGKLAPVYFDYKSAPTFALTEGSLANL